MKTFLKKIFLLAFILPLLGAVNFREDQTGGCEGLPNFNLEDNGKVVLTTKSISRIETDTEIIVYGEVENKGNASASKIKLTATLKDIDGNTIETVGPEAIIGVSKRFVSSPDTIDHSTLSPGEKGYFVITAEKSDTQNEVDTVQTSLTSEDSLELQSLNANMSASITTSKDKKKNLTINGSLKNNSKKTDTWNNKITVIVKNKAGKIVSIGEESLGDTLTIDGKQREYAIRAGGKKSFIFTTDINFDTVEKKNIKTNINWEEEGPQAPNAPSDLEIELKSATEVTITFTDNSSDENGFRIFRKDPGESKFKRIKQLSASSGTDESITYTDKTLTAGKIYTYKVLAFNDIGNSEFSSSEKIKISAPDAPANLKATITSASETTTQITLSWDEKEISASLAELPSEVKFPSSLKDKIEYDSDRKLLIFDGAMSAAEKTKLKTLSKDKDYLKAIGTLYAESNITNNEVGFSIIRDDVEIATVLADTTSYDDDDVLAGSTYSYKITAFNLLGTSSAIGPVTITYDKPEKPASLTVEKISSTSNKLTWDGDSINNEQGFKIERKAGTGDFSQIATVGQDEETYTDKLVNPATTYTYRVIAYNALGDSDPSNEVEASP